MPYGTPAGALNQELTAVNHTAFPTKTSLDLPLEGKPHRGIGTRTPLGLVGQGKGISLTTVPHGPGATDCRIHEVGR